MGLLVMSLPRSSSCLSELLSIVHTLLNFIFAAGKCNIKSSEDPPLNAGVLVIKALVLGSKAGRNCQKASMDPEVEELQTLATFLSRPANTGVDDLGTDRRVAIGHMSISYQNKINS
jgi:hypothetical protein